MNLSEIIRRQQKAVASRRAAAAAGGRKGAPVEDDGFLPFADLWQKDDKGPAAKQPDAAQIHREKQEASRRQGEEILRQAQENAARIEREAYEKGFAEGRQDGLAEGLGKFEPLTQQFEGLYNAIHGQREAVNSRYEGDLLVLVKTMVDRLVNHEVSVNPRVIEACLKKAMEYVVENSLVRVHLNPDDFNRLKAAGLEDPALLEGRNTLQLVEDPGVSAGGCLLSTDFGEIDATIENCRDRLYEAVDRAFLDALRNEGSGGS